MIFCCLLLLTIKRHLLNFCIKAISHSRLCCCTAYQHSFSHLSIWFESRWKFIIVHMHSRFFICLFSWELVKMCRGEGAEADGRCSFFFWRCTRRSECRRAEEKNGWLWSPRQQCVKIVSFYPPNLSCKKTQKVQSCFSSHAHWLILSFCSLLFFLSSSCSSERYPAYMHAQLE